jgi:hypothetical protein
MSRIRHLGKLIALCVALNPLISCSHTPKLPVEEVDSQQQRSVLNGIQAVRGAFNNDACQSIYDQAGAEFRRGEQKEDWLQTCKQIRSNWGRWDKFTADAWNRPSDQTIAVEGKAVFAKGECVLQVLWILDHEHTQLRWLFLSTGKEPTISAPPLPAPLHFDPRAHGRIPG